MLTSYEFAKIVLEPLGIPLNNLQSAVIFIEARKDPMVHCRYLATEYPANGEPVTEEITRKFRIEPIEEEE